MHIADFEQLANKYGFTRVGEIVLNGALPSFQLSHASKEEGWVYLWLEVSGPDCTVVYVGMAGSTLKARCNQHTSGFRSSTPGKAHAERLRQGFAAGHRYEVYVRESGLGTFHDEADIPLCSVEELAFISKFQPTWNKGRLYKGSVGSGAGVPV